MIPVVEAEDGRICNLRESNIVLVPHIWKFETGVLDVQSNVDSKCEVQVRVPP